MPWYVAVEARELRAAPLARTVAGSALVLFRDGDGSPRALADACPHRNAPLSAGRVVPLGLECAYHGWTFAGDGRCRAVPGLLGEADRAGRAVAAFPAAEFDGWVWVHTGSEAPAGPPPRPAGLALAGAATARATAVFEAPLAEVAENILDVPHTAFLHRGWFRGRRNPCEVEAIVRRGSDRVEAEYIGEPRPSGLIGRILAPREGQVRHVDRFVLPSCCEVEYGLGDSALAVTSYLTPEGPERTRLHALAAWRSPLPAALVRLVAEPVARRILEQDAAILAAQGRTIRSLGGPRFASTELDLLGHHVRDLLARGPGGAAAERRLRLRI